MSKQRPNPVTRIKRRQAIVLGLMIAFVVFLAFTIGWWTPIVISMMVGGYIGVKGGLADAKRRDATEKSTYLPHQPGGQTVQVREYKSLGQFQADAQRRMAVGWTIQGQSSVSGGISLPGTIAKGVIYHPWAAISPSRKDDKVVVTWVRNPS